jgi:hypothetical protein
MQERKGFLLPTTMTYATASRCFLRICKQQGVSAMHPRYELKKTAKSFETLNITKSPPTSRKEIIFKAKDRISLKKKEGTTRMIICLENDFFS